MNEVTIASIIGAGTFGGALAAGVYLGADRDARTEYSAAPTRPAILSTRSANEGAHAYDHYCAACHGRAGEGARRGPPLVHARYDIGVKSDSIFLAAMRRGAPQKHWRYGPMPPIKGVSPRQMSAIVGFVAELQVFNQL